jgi:hypothetical protein
MNRQATFTAWGRGRGVKMETNACVGRYLEVSDSVVTRCVLLFCWAYSSYKYF